MRVALVRRSECVPKNLVSRPMPAIHWLTHFAASAMSPVFASFLLCRFERHLDRRFTLQPYRYWELTSAQKFWIEQFRLRTSAMLSKDGDDYVAWSQLLGEAHRARDVYRSGTAET